MKMQQIEEKIPRTRRGYDIFEVASALQKCIRRGDEYQAVYWALELEGFNGRMVWNRLRAIASEDIGLADPLATLVVDVLEKNYADAVRRKNDAYRLFLAHAVLYLSKAPKNRMVDDLLQKAEAWAETTGTS
jgi:replication-associated recombination protein RarA